MNKYTNFVGIDIGNSYGKVAVYKNNQVELVPNKFGGYMFPSYLTFSEYERFFGEISKNYAGIYAKNTVYDIKRLLRYSEPKDYEDDHYNLNKYPFEIITNNKDIADNKEESNKLIININDKHFYPELLYAMLLEKLKLEAEEYLKEHIQSVVLTVPAYFNSDQRKAILGACQIINLPILNLLNDPTAVAISCGLNYLQKYDTKNILIFDYGGGSLDISIIVISNGVIEVKATNGTAHLGGENLDYHMVYYCIDEFIKVNKLTEEDKNKIIDDKRIMNILKMECEKIKKSLSHALVGYVIINSFYNGKDLEIKIMRAQFEEICSEEFNKISPLIKTVLDCANMTNENINKIILTGGSSRIPKIKEIICNHFHNELIEFCIEDAVVKGATIYAYTLSSPAHAITLVDVTPLSLGVESIGGEMIKIIKRNSSIPCCQEYKFSTTYDNQTHIQIKIYEGDRILTKDNYLIGTFELIDLPPMPKGILRINLRFEIDVNNILHVTAFENTTGRINKLTITNNKRHFLQSDIIQMLEDAKKYTEKDKAEKIRIYIINTFIKQLNTLKSILSICPENQYPQITESYHEMEQWFNNHSQLTVIELKSQLKNLENLLNILRPTTYNLISINADQNMVFETSTHVGYLTEH